MANMTTTFLLDNTVTAIQDTSATLRARLLNWLNDAIQSIALERDWLCLRQTVACPVSGKSITKPSDYGRMVEMRGDGTQWVLTDQHHLSDTSYYGMQNSNGVWNSPIGWVEDATTITLLNVPGTATIYLTYIPELGTYAEGATIPFPIRFSNWFQRAVLTAYYEYDMDERYAFSAQQTGEELKKLKHNENLLLLPKAAYTRNFGLVNTDAR